MLGALAGRRKCSGSSNEEGERQLLHLGVNMRELWGIACQAWLKQEDDKEKGLGCVFSSSVAEDIF